MKQEKTLLISFRRPKRYKILFTEWISKHTKTIPLPKELSKETLKLLEKLLTELRILIMRYLRKFPSIIVS